VKSLAVAVYDDVAEHYDASRGGEQRGDDFAKELHTRLPSGEGPILDIGVGTGVISLGLTRLQRSVVGIDIAAAMLARARSRLGGVLVRGDARRLPFADESIPHAVSVWVVHAIIPPPSLFSEVIRVLLPGGRYLVCPTNRMGVDDPTRSILDSMFDRASRIHPTWSRNPVDAQNILTWGLQAGFAGAIETFSSRPWDTSAEELTTSIRDRVWPALQGLDDDAYVAVTEPAFQAIRSLPRGPITQRAEVDIVVLIKAPGR
jgi:ubiquinone/menaquinone biosynthesis C-methylase UbiE